MYKDCAGSVCPYYELVEKWDGRIIPHCSCEYGCCCSEIEDDEDE